MMETIKYTENPTGPEQIEKIVESVENE